MFVFQDSNRSDSLDISPRTKHNVQKEKLFKTLAEDLDNSIHHHTAEENREFKDSVAVPSRGSGGEFTGTGFKGTTGKDNVHPKQVPHDQSSSLTSNAFRPKELTSTELFSIQGQIQSRKSLPYPGFPGRQVGSVIG